MAKATTPRKPIEELASLRMQIAELKARREQLIAQVTVQMSRTFHDARVGLCCFDAELRYVQVNEFLAAINGLSVEEHIGNSVIEVLPETAAAGVENELRRVLESGEPVIRGTVTTKTPAHPEEEKTYMHDYYAIRSDDGEIVGVSCCIVDITDLRQEEQERENQSREIEEVKKMAVGCKLRTIDLKREVNELCEQLGIKPKYEAPFDETYCQDRPELPPAAPRSPS